MSTPDTNHVVSCKDTYEDSNGAKILLMSMIIGLPDIGDLTVEPYASSLQKKAFTPKKIDLIKEVERRVKCNPPDKGRKPKPSNWTMPSLREWLLHHPVTDEDDLQYLRQEVEKFQQTLLAAHREATSMSSSSTPSGVIWNNTADLRLIHCLAVDEVKEAYLQRHQVMSRSQLDARNGPTAGPCVNEILARQYNNSSFQPRSISLPDLHMDFVNPIDLSFDNVPCAVTPDQVKRWLADRKTKLVLMITKWEKSGNGGGNKIEDERFGQTSMFMDDADFQDDDDRSNYLGNNRSSLFYYWHMAAEHDILSQTVNILPSELSATTESISPVAKKSGYSKKRKTTEVNQLPQDVVDGFKSISRASKSEEVANCETRIEKGERRVEDFIKKLEDSQNDGLRQFYNERLLAAKTMLANATDEYERLQENSNE